MPVAVRSDTSPARTRRGGRPDHRHDFQDAGEQRQKHRVVDAENDPEPDIGGDRRVGHDRQHADEVAQQHRVEPRPDARHQRAAMRRHDPENAACNLLPAHQEVEQQDDGEKHAHDEGQAESSQEADLVGLGGPVAQPVERALRDLVGVERGAEQRDRLVAKGLPGEVLDDALKIAGDAADLDQEPFAGEDERSVASTPNSSRNSATASNSRGSPLRLAAQSKPGVKM